VRKWIFVQGFAKVDFCKSLYRLNNRAGLTLDFPIRKILDYKDRIDEFKQSNNVIEQVICVYLECQQKRETLKKRKKRSMEDHETQKETQAQEWFNLKTEIMIRLHGLNIDDVLCTSKNLMSKSSIALKSLLCNDHHGNKTKF